MTLNFEQLGQGPRKVLVTHNWMSTIRSYDLVRPLLDDQANSYVFVDLRGYGLNRGVTGAYTAAEAAADLLAVADALGWPRFHVVGHSMSGMVAQRLCVDATARVQSLTAVTPVTAAGMALDDASLQMFAAAATQDAPWLAIAKMMTSAGLPERWYLQQLAQFRAAVDPLASLGYLKMFSNTRFAEQMQGLHTPTHAILGGQDFAAFSEPAIRQTLGQWLPSLEVDLIASAGHFPMLETPPAFAQALERFLVARA
jgi:pimeloyl-ACP methyl ester carboxylesterase